jgi:hypothetical protein
LILIGFQLLEALNLLVIPSSFTSNLFDYKNVNKEEKELIQSCKKADNRAILPLPWFHIGSEIYAKEVSSETLRHSFLLSAHTGIPLYAVMMGRTSKQQTIDYFHSLGSEKAVGGLKLNHLFIYHLPSSVLYEEDEQLILNKAISLRKNHRGELKYHQNILYNQGVKKNFKQVISDNFDDQKKWGGQINNNKFRGLIENYNTILSLDSSQVKPYNWYEITFDYFPDWTKPIDNVCYIEYIDPKTKEVRWFYSRSVGSYTGIKKNSIEVKIRFKSQDFPCVYHCFLRGSGKNIFFEVDNLRVRELLK